MKQILYILSVILGIVAVICLVGSVVLDRTDTIYTLHASAVFGVGFCAIMLAALLFIARNWFYGTDAESWN